MHYFMQNCKPRGGRYVDIIKAMRASKSMLHESQLIIRIFKIRVHLWDDA